MSQCLIRNSEYRIKLAQSGLSEPVFYSFANSFNAKYGRLPNLDEIPNVDSRESLISELDINNGAAYTNTILAVTNSQNISEANIKLNDMHSDLEISLLPLNEETIVNVKRRPSQYETAEVGDIQTETNFNQSVIFNQIFNKLRKLYGIELNAVTEQELKKAFPDVRNVSAFISDGNIYINTDLADIDAPIHEMTHILLGSIRFKNPQLYMNLVKLSESFPSLYDIKRNNPNRAYSDILEETFVQEVASYLAGRRSVIHKLDNTIKYEIHYNLLRLLDSVLMGEYSVKSIKNPYEMSLPQLANWVNSQELSKNTLCSLEDASLHRMLGNKKEELIKKGDLKEECE